ncbi:Vitamin B12 transporter BtuB [Brevundimonas sp. NIBR10]|uniref:TonB-dependent receptor n=1 Tax=Brevundimonas sp. NIBR10 TaxID=3015997 RepID=UPI0022F18195|nr:TonB-dependent receptor [Brevundimonas sp. NIBR10]WGM45288.1 Vitamin B12 transporter BtuB [Brevundimonas sp. NIBR10]
MRLTQSLRYSVSAAVVGAVAFGLVGAASAQDQEGPSTSVDDIIVTAQKREQSLQDVPIVVTSLSAEALDNAGVKDIKDLQILTPGMTVTSTSSEASTTVRIRGVGTVGDNPGLESSVGVVIDGVYRSRNSVGFGDLGELQRIEVLKGPQGTLFGKNTSAGVINIITQAPSFTPGYNAELTAGNYGAFGASGSVTGPINDQVAFRLYAGRRVRDGFTDINLGDGPRTDTDDGNQDFWTARGQLLVLPNDNTSIRIIADYSKRDEYCCVGVQVRTGQTYPFIDGLSTGTGQAPPNATFSGLPFSRLGYANREDGQTIEDKGLSAEANIDLNRWGDATLTTVSSWRRWKSSLGQDIDYTGADINYRVNDGDYGYGVENWTQEVRLAGATDRLDWLVGAFATREQVSRTDSFYNGADYTPFLSFLLSANLNRAVPQFPVSPGIIGCFTRPGQTSGGTGLQGCLASGGTGQLPVGPGGAIVTIPTAQATGPGFIVGQGFRDRYNQTSESFALFTNNTFHLTDQFDITVGLRYTSDTKSVDSLQTNLNNNSSTCNAALANAGAIGGLLGAATAGSIVGTICLPWVNSAFQDRVAHQEFDDSEVSGTIKAAYRLNDQLLTYVSYARGYKSFGYNLDRTQTGVTPNASTFFPSETVDSYEAGFKATLFDRKVLFNATYFNQKVENFQLNTFLGTAFTVEAIPELNSQGFDADFLWFTPIEGLSVSSGLTYTDAEYGVFTAAQLTQPSNFPQLSLLPGGTPAFAPEWSSTNSVNFERTVGNLLFGASLSAKYSSEYNTGSDLLPYKGQDAYTLVNGRITLGTADDRWTVELWGQNLTDKEYIQVGYAAPLQGTAFQSTLQTAGSNPGTFYNAAADTATYDAFLGAPRTYGITFKVKY